MIGDTVVYNWGRREAVPCACGSVGLFSASLLPAAWMQSPKHLPATDCMCGKWYYSWSKEKAFEQKTVKGMK